jgi:hypothetical protein
MLALSPAERLRVLESAYGACDLPMGDAVREAQRRIAEGRCTPEQVGAF